MAVLAGGVRGALRSSRRGRSRRAGRGGSAPSRGCAGSRGWTSGCPGRSPSRGTRSAPPGGRPGCSRRAGPGGRRCSGRSRAPGCPRPRPRATGCRPARPRGPGGRGGRRRGCARRPTGSFRPRGSRPRPSASAMAIRVRAKPCRSSVLWVMGGTRTTDDRTPRSAKPITAFSASVRPPGLPASSSVPGRPRFATASVPDVPTSALPVPASASPNACRTARSAAIAAAQSPERIRSWSNARWMTPSASAAALASPSRSVRSPRCTDAPYAVTVAAAASDRARPTTSCPAAMSSGTMAEPRWPDAPVTKIRIATPAGAGVWPEQ